MRIDTEDYTRLLATIDELQTEIQPTRDEVFNLHTRLGNLKVENERLGELLEDVVNEALTVDGIPESTPNAAGSLQSTEPTPGEMVGHAIRLTRKAAEAENVRLRRDLEVFVNDAVKFYERVRDIWQEGFEDGESHGNLPYKYPPMVIAWLFSKAYSTVEEDPERHVALRFRWRRQNYNDRESTVVRWKDLETPATPSEDA